MYVSAKSCKAKQYCIPTIVMHLTFYEQTLNTFTKHIPLKKTLPCGDDIFHLDYRAIDITNRNLFYI